MKRQQIPKKNEKNGKSSNNNITRGRTKKDLSIINPESGSTHTPVAALRRSTRLSSASYKSAPTTSPQPSSTRFKNKKNSSSLNKRKFQGINTCYKVKYDDAAKAKRFQRLLQISLRRYKGKFCYGPDDEKRTCILSGGDTFSWIEKSCGTTWIAVNGAKPYCVVAIDTHVEQDLKSYSPDDRPPVNITLLTVLADIGADTCSAFNQNVAQRPDTGPFAVVSVAPGTVESSHECEQASRAIDFLKEKLKDRSALTYREIVQIAVCSLKYLLGPKFKSNQLQAFSYDGVSYNGDFGIMSESEVDVCLNALNETSISSCCYQGDYYQLMLSKRQPPEDAINHQLYMPS